MTEFEFRAFDRQIYDEVVPLLQRIEAADAAALEQVLGRVRPALADEGLFRRNARSSQVRFWSDWVLSGPKANGETAAKLGEIAVAILCMPEFQTYPLAGDSPSPTLVILGDSDGGLFGVLTEHVPWFEPWLTDGLQRRAERYGYGRNMFLVDHADLVKLRGPFPLEPFLGEYGLTALRSLGALVDAALARRGWTLSVAEGG